jgi:hypothetical protein
MWDKLHWWKWHKNRPFFQSHTTNFIICIPFQPTEEIQIPVLSKVTENVNKQTKKNPCYIATQYEFSVYTVNIMGTIGYRVNYYVQMWMHNIHKQIDIMLDFTNVKKQNDKQYCNNQKPCLHSWFPQKTNVHNIVMIKIPLTVKM